MNLTTTKRFDELITALKKRAYRLTPQRLELVRLIADSQGHPNAAQIYERIRLRFPTMSQATVYKTLALLKEIGQVLEIDLHGDSHYDGHRPQPHPHLVCTQCSRIVDGELELDPLEIRQVEQASGYRITHPQITFYGLCPQCRSKSD